MLEGKRRNEIRHDPCNLFFKEHFSSIHTNFQIVENIISSRINQKITRLHKSREIYLFYTHFRHKTSDSIAITHDVHKGDEMYVFIYLFTLTLTPRSFFHALFTLHIEREINSPQNTGK